MEFTFCSSPRPCALGDDCPSGGVIRRDEDMILTDAGVYLHAADLAPLMGAVADAATVAAEVVRPMMAALEAIAASAAPLYALAAAELIVEEEARLAAAEAAAHESSVGPFPGWTWAHAEAAHREGWWISNDPDGNLEIQALADETPFDWPTDQAVVDYCMAWASASSPLEQVQMHQIALALTVDSRSWQDPS